MFYGKTTNLEQAKKDLGALTELVLFGTVKVHGTNAGIHVKDGKVTFLSRTRILSLDSDNSGFMNAMVDKVWVDAVASELHVYGEWCGGNIQKGVAISGGDKYFVVFKVLSNGIEISTDKAKKLFKINAPVQFIEDFGLFYLTGTLADLEPKLLQYTAQVEEKCPVGTVLNPNSNNTVGEGIVWRVSGSSYRFKTKGEKHKRASAKNIKVANVSTVPAEVRSVVQDAIKAWVNGDRLEQGKEALQELGLTLEPKNFGEYLKWIHKDIMEEENVVDIIALHEDITWNRLSKEITAIAKEYYL